MPKQNLLTKSTLIGIAGGTGSGKTTVARQIIDAFDVSQVVLLEFDHYYKDLKNMPEQIRNDLNFDHPDSLEVDLLYKHLKSLKSGKSINRPTYDFKTHSRQIQTVEIMPAPIIILEGILALSFSNLRDLMDIKIFVDTEADIRFIRRLSRDVAERGRTMENVIKQYLTTVKLMHDEFVEPSKRYANLIIPEGSNDVALDMLINTISMKLFPKYQ